MSEYRRHTRVKEIVPVRWKMLHQDIQGEGIIRNVSISGLMIEVDDRFKLTDNTQFILDVTDPSMQHLIPHDVKLVWFSRIMADKMRQFCGMKFTNTSGPVFARLAEHVQERTALLGEATNLNILQNYLSQSN